MPFFDDRGFYKRAQITPSDLALAGVAEFDDLDRLTIFADNLVPHVLRVDGVLRYEDCAGGADRRRRAARARRRGARDPRLRPARLRADRGRARRAAAHARHLAVEPRARSRATRRARGTGRARSSTEALAPGRVAAAACAAAARTSAPSGRLPVELGDHALQLVHAARPGPLRASATGSGRWAQSASGPSGRLPSTRTGWPGLPTTVELAGTSWITTELAPIFEPLAHLDRAEQLGARADDHVVAHGRMALAALEAGAAERHALVERHVVRRSRRSRRSRRRRRGR